MNRYAARARIPGWDTGDIEGPLYRYFYAKNMGAAHNRLNRSMCGLFANLSNFFGDEYGLGYKPLLSLAIKRVGKNHKWYVLFNYEKEHREAGTREFERQLKEFKDGLKFDRQNPFLPGFD